MSNNTSDSVDEKKYCPNESILSVKPIKPSSIYVSTSSVIYLPNDINTRDELVKYIERLTILE